MSGWVKILKSDTCVYYTVIVLFILLVLLIIISFFCVNIGTQISIICSVLGSIITAIIIVYFTIFKNLIIPLKKTFENLHSEIIFNAKKLEEFPVKCDNLKNEWLEGNPTGFTAEFGRKWLPKFEAESYNPISQIKYSWRYLKIGFHPKLLDLELLSQIEGLGFKSENFKLFWNYQQICHQFCDEIQELESEGNIYCTYLGILSSMNTDEAILPQYILECNKFKQRGTIKITKSDCIHYIEQIIKKMKDNCEIFVNNHSKYYNLVRDVKMNDFLNSLLN